MYTHVSAYHLRYRLVRDVDSGANHRRSLPRAVAVKEEREVEWSRTSASGQALTGRAGGGLRWRWVAESETGGGNLRVAFSSVCMYSYTSCVCIYIDVYTSMYRSSPFFMLQFSPIFNWGWRSSVQKLKSYVQNKKKLEKLEKKKQQVISSTVREQISIIFSGGLNLDVSEMSNVI